MSIIKLEIRLKELHKAIEAFKNNRKAALEELSNEVRNVIGNAVNELMNAEIDVFLGRPEQADNKHALSLRSQVLGCAPEHKRDRGHKPPI